MEKCCFNFDTCYMRSQYVAVAPKVVIKTSNIFFMRVSKSYWLSEMEYELWGRGRVEGDGLVLQFYN